MSSETSSRFPVVSALSEGTRTALTTLAESLARQIDTHSGEPSERLSLVRAFLAVLRDLEGLDRARVREARLSARLPPTAASTDGTGIVDELREHRKRRRA